MLSANISLPLTGDEAKGGAVLQPADLADIMALSPGRAPFRSRLRYYTGDIDLDAGVCHGRLEISHDVEDGAWVGAATGWLNSVAAWANRPESIVRGELNRVELVGIGTPGDPDYTENRVVSLTDLPPEKQRTPPVNRASQP